MIRAEPASTPQKPNLSEFLDRYCFEQSEYGDLNNGVVKSSKNSALCEGGELVILD